MDDLSVYAKRPAAFFARYVKRTQWPTPLFCLRSRWRFSAPLSPNTRVKLLVDTLSQPSRARSGRGVAGLRLPRRADRRRQPAVATGELGRQLHFRGRDRRRAPRPLPPSDRPCAELFCQPFARHADQPHHRHVKRALHSREHARVECAAAVPGDGVRHRLRRHGKLGDGGLPRVVAGIVIVVMFGRAAAGKPLHHEFADRAAAVDGEMTDVVGNMAIVKSFGGLLREHRRFDATVEREMTARRQSLRYLERLRIMHALVTVVLTIALLAWAIVLWKRGAATTGDVILVCTLGLSVLHATRDLAVALVDVTQHMARFSEALSTLLVPHQLCDRPGAATLRATQRQRHIRGRHVRLSRTVRPSSEVSTSTSAPGSAWVLSAHRAPANPRSSHCSSASTTSSRGGS